MTAQDGNAARRFRWTIIFEAEDENDAAIQSDRAYGEFDAVEAAHLEELEEDDVRV